MIHYLYSVRDIRAKIFGPILQTRSMAEVCRGIMNNMDENPKSNLAKFPGDFDLYRVGTFDDVTGEVKFAPQPEKIVPISELAATLQDPVGGERDAS